jgi:hypothetical protein
MIIFLFWFALALGVGAWASNKGRSGIGFFILAVFISPLIAGVIVACVSRNETNIARKGGLFQCSQCQEFVKPGAVVCRYCNARFQTPAGSVAQVA